MEAPCAGCQQLYTILDIMEPYEKDREILSLPYYVFPAVMAVFGHPAESQKKRKKPLRFNAEYIVYENEYPSERDCRAMFDKRRGTQDYEEWVRQFCDRKYSSYFADELRKSVNKYLEQY